MDNKYVLVVLAAVMGTIAHFLLTMPFFAGAGGEATDAAWYAAILAVGLGAGNTGGTDAVSILVEGIKGYVGTMINFAIFGVVIHLAISMGLDGGAFDVNGVINAAATFVVSALMANLTLSYLKKAA